MLIFDKYVSIISKMIVGGEEMLNLCELVKCMKEDKTAPEIEECIIMPYYIDNGNTYELYQYEFCVEQEEGESFEEYIQRLTGKRIDDIPNDVVRIRQMCFSRIGDGGQGNTYRQIIDYFIFLISDKSIRQEIIGIFSEFDPNNLFIFIY